MAPLLHGGDQVIPAGSSGLSRRDLASRAQTVPVLTSESTPLCSHVACSGLEVLSGGDHRESGLTLPIARVVDTTTRLPYNRGTVQECWGSVSLCPCLMPIAPQQLGLADSMKED